MRTGVASVAAAEANLQHTQRGNLLVIVLGASGFPNHPSFHQETEKNAAFGQSCRAVQHLFLQLGVPHENICDLCDVSAEPKQILDTIYDFIVRRCVGTPASQHIEDVVLYYVGHGVGNREQYSLLLRDSDPALLAETSLRFASLMARVKRAADEVRRQCRHELRQFYLIDACLAGRAKYAADPSVVSGAKGRRSKDGLPTTGIAVLASSNDNEASLTLPGHKYTLFTLALLAAATWPEPDRDRLRARYGDKDLSLANLREIMNDWLAKQEVGDQCAPTVVTIPLDTFAGDPQDVPLLPNPLTSKQQIRSAPLPRRRSWTVRALIPITAALLALSGLCVVVGIVAKRQNQSPALTWEITPEPLFAEPSKIHPLIRKIPPERRVQYVRGDGNESAVIRSQLAYRDAVWNGKRVAGVDFSLSPFAWEFPQLCFLLTNQSPRDVIVSGAKFKALTVELATRPLLVVQEGALERLHFRNEGWGLVENPILSFSVVEVDDRSPTTQYAHQAPLDSFEEERVLALGSYIPAALAEQDEVRVHGELAYHHAGQLQQFLFTTTVATELPGQAAVPVSAAYDIEFHAQPGETQWVEAKHRLSAAGSDEAVDRFLVRVASTRAATYHFEVELHTDAGVLEQLLELEVFVPRAAAGDAE